MNSGFSFDSDTIMEIFCVVAVILSVFMAVMRFRAGKPISACLWLLGGGLWAAVLIFLLTFSIRLM